MKNANGSVGCMNITCEVGLLSLASGIPQKSPVSGRSIKSFRHREKNKTYFLFIRYNFLKNNGWFVRAYYVLGAIKVFYMEKQISSYRNLMS